MKFVNFILYHKKTLLLITILTFSFGIKVWHLSTNPAGFFCDEAVAGVDAYSFLKTGKDHHGEIFPLFFKGLINENAGPFHVYGIIPFILLFGLTENAVRLPGIIISTFEILFFYFLLKELIPKKFALIGALLLAISPWHFHTSRNNMGDIYMWSFLILLAIFSLIKGYKLNKILFYLLSAFFLGLAMYTYLPSRLITPLFLTFIFFFLIFARRFKLAFLMAGIFLIICIPFIYFHLTDPYSFQRVKDTIGIDIRNRQVTSLLNRDFLARITKKYLLHYSDTFLFIKGDADFPGQVNHRQSIIGLGLMYPYQKWLIIAGLIWLFYEIFFKKRFELLFVIFLLLLFPVPDSLTLDKTPFATRSYLGVLPFHLLIAFGIYGIYQLLEKFHLWKYIIIKTLAISLLSFFIITSFVTLMIKFSDNPLTTSDYWGWQYGQRDIIHYFTSVESEYNQLIMEPKFNAPDIFFKFYAPNNCQKCLLGDLAIFDPAKKQLFALSNEYFKEHPSLSYKIKKIIYYPNGETAFKIIEVNNN